MILSGYEGQDEEVNALVEELFLGSKWKQYLGKMDLARCVVFLDLDGIPVVAVSRVSMRGVLMVVQIGHF